MYTLPKGLVRVHLRKRKGHSIASAAPISGTSLPLGDKKNRHHNKLPNHYNTGLQQVMFSGQQSQAGRHTPIRQQAPARQVCQVGQQSDSLKGPQQRLLPQHILSFGQQPFALESPPSLGQRIEFDQLLAQQDTSVLMR